MSPPKGGLGRGLGALMGDAAIQEAQQGQGSLSVPISKVQPGLNQPRRRFDEEALAELADSIQTHGIIQPITVRRLQSGYYQIIAGERRWRAAKQAGLQEVPVVVIEADDRKVMELGLIENLQREDLNPLEEAMGYQSLIRDFGLTQEEVSNRVGKSRPAVSNAIRLLDLPESTRLLLEEGKLSAGHARAILSVKDPADQKTLTQRIIDDGLSVRQAEALAKRLNQPPAQVQPREDPYKLYREAAAKDLSQRFGRKVSITQGAKKGRVELEYYDDNDLNALLDLLEQVRVEKKEGTPLA